MIRQLRFRSEKVDMAILFIITVNGWCAQLCNKRTRINCLMARGRIHHTTWHFPSFMQPIVLATNVFPDLKNRYEGSIKPIPSFA